MISNNVPVAYTVILAFEVDTRKCSAGSMSICRNTVYVLGCTEIEDYLISDVSPIIVSRYALARILRKEI